MTSWFKNLALAVAVFCAVWIGMLWQWRAHPRELTAADLWLYLGVLPLVVFGLLLAGRWAVTAAWQRQRPAVEADAGGPAPATPAAAEGPQSWALLGQWVQLPAGADADAVLAAAEAGSPRPAPDAQLRDDEGLPVLAARMPALDMAAVAAALPQPDRLGEAGLRALACLQPVAQMAAAQLQSWADRFAAPAGPGQGPVRRVRVLVHWPEAWSDAAITQATDWLAAQLRQSGEPAVPPACWLVQAVPGSGVALLAAADKLLETLARQSCDDLVLTLACHSDLDRPTIDRMQREQTLFRGERQPRGVMPGEGAAGLLWAMRAWPQEDERPVLDCSRLQVACREQPVDAPGRTRARELAEAVDQLLARLREPAEQICALVSDSDQHTPRATELFAVSLGRLPQLDPAEDMRLLGPFLGHLGGAAPSVALAGAAAWAAQGRAPLLAVSVGDRRWRLVARLRPLSSASPDSAEAAS